MKIYTIHKGHHYSNFFPKVQLLFHVNYLSQRSCIVFDESCKYEINDASCINNLFGLCFGFGVYKNSIRFGWSYNALTNQIYIWKYFYINGELEKEKIFACEVGEPHFYEIKIVKLNNNKDTYHIILKIDNQKVYPLDNFQDTIKFNKCFITTLGPYLNENIKAHHTMKIKYYGSKITKLN